MTLEWLFVECFAMFVQLQHQAWWLHSPTVVSNFCGGVEYRGRAYEIVDVGKDEELIVWLREYEASVLAVDGWTTIGIEC